MRLVVTGWIISTLRFLPVFTFPVLGEVFAERSGVINISIEGVMTFGAALGYLGTFISGSYWVGFAMGLFGGAILGLIMAVLTVTLRLDQIVCGFGLYFLGLGLGGIIDSAAFTGLEIKLPNPELLGIPFLSSLAYIEKLNSVVPVSIVIVAAAAFVLYRTPFGLRIRAVGMNPQAADSAGVKVFLTRYLCVVFGGAMAGLGGAYLSTVIVRDFSQMIVGGRGWVVLAIVIFGRWDPYRALAGVVLFSSLWGLRFRIQLLDLGIPEIMLRSILQSLPFIVTIVILALINVYGGKAGAPLAMLKPYRRD